MFLRLVLLDFRTVLTMWYSFALHFIRFILSNLNLEVSISITNISYYNLIFVMLKIHKLYEMHNFKYYSSCIVAFATLIYKTDFR
jgi:hypothetical protein